MSRRTRANEVGPYFTDDRSDLAGFLAKRGISFGGRVLEVGCAAGAAGPQWRMLGAATLEGIEPFPPAAEAASASGVYDAVHCGTFENWVPRYPPYDAVIFADVLEHLADPTEALHRVHAVLARPSGKLVLSLPNVRHVSVLADLLFRGDWRYRPAGILDETHLRFFTRRSGARLLQETGFRQEALGRYGAVRASRLLATLWPWLGEFLLSELFLVAAPVLASSQRQGDAEEA